jgi:hypothetical protein
LWHLEPKIVIPAEITGSVSDRVVDLKLESKIGRSVLPANGESAAGFACETCHVSFKDSASFVSHINSQLHIRASGLSLKQKKSSVDDVRAKLQAAAAGRLAQASLQKPKSSGSMVATAVISANSVDNCAESSVEDGSATQKRPRKKKKKRVPQEEDPIPPVGDSEMMALMGITDFGGSNKKQRN